jgi:hypothetical protein
MQMILESAHTWFLESCTLHPSDGLVIRLVEGIKGRERQPVSVADRVLGPHFPVTIEPNSRCAIIHFDEVRCFFTYNESYDTEDSELKAEGGRRFVRRVESSTFRNFTGKTTTAIDEFRDACIEYLVWCEDQVFQVFTSREPEIALVDTGPDLSIKRGRTWSSN